MPEVPGYDVEAEIGRGGMGVVYRARQVHADRVVALKMISSGDRSRPEDLLRFRLEGESLARLRHPNVVQVYEVGLHLGRPFFSMEYVAGGTLAARVASLAGRPREAAALVETLARAVHAAHLCGVLHRDLKPANILVDDAHGLTPKVTDFGLAKRVGTDSGLTQTGEILGSPSYMAPEQASAGATVGVPADVYALGAILYELLCGRPPFREATTWGTLMKVVHEPPPPPLRWRPGVPRDLEVVCLKCLSKQPSGRYPSADALADDLRRYLDGETILARPAAWPERAWKWARRHPGAASALAAAALGLAAVLGLTLAYNARLSKALGRANLAERAAAANAREAGRQRDFALKALNDLVYGVQDRLGQTPATRALKQSLLDTAIVGLRELAKETESGAPDLSRADAHRRLGDLFLQVGRTPEAMAQYRQSTSLAERLHAARPDDPDVLATLAASYDRTGERLMEANHPEQAVPLLRKAVDLASRRARIAPSDAATQGTLEALQDLTRAYLWQRRPEEAREAVEGLSALAGSWAGRSPADPKALVALADSQVLAADVAELAGKPYRGLLDSAVATMRRVLALDPSNRGHRDDLLIPLGHLADLAFAEGRFDDAARGYEELIGLLTASAAEDPEHLDTQLKLIDAQYNLAASERNRGRYEESASRLRPAVERLRALKGQGRLRGLAVYEGERLPVMEADLAFCEAAPRGLADREFARSRPPALASRLLVYRLRKAASEGRADDAAADAEALLALDAGEPLDLRALGRARVACLGFLEPGSDLRERCASAGVAALARAVDLGDREFDALQHDPLYGPVRARPDFQAILTRLGDDPAAP
jgi:serine/threonine-protein kinase